MPKFFFHLLLTSSALGAVLLAGCGGNSAASPPTPKAKHPVALAATSTSQPVQATPDLAPTETPAPQPTATAQVDITATVAVTDTPQPVVGAPSLISASVSPVSPVPGGSINVTVITSGPVSKVTMYLGSGSPTGPSPRSYYLSRSSPGTWVGGGTVPSVPGQYHYTVGLFSASGRRIVVDRDAWNVTVSGGPATAAPVSLSFPDDVPLVPPFSYGSPQAAVFSAGGQTVSGAEVVSTARPDVSASVVAQWYETHFPRAGWTVSSGGVPAAGAGSFSMEATKGKRVCIVEYSSSTVHLFYGTLT